MEFVCEVRSDLPTMSMCDLATEDRIDISRALSNWVASCNNVDSCVNQWEGCRRLLAEVSAHRSSFSRDELRPFYDELVASLRETELLSSIFFTKYFLDLCSVSNSVALNDKDVVKLSKLVTIVCNWHKLLENMHYSICDHNVPIFMSRKEYDLMLAKTIILLIMRVRPSVSASARTESLFECRFQIVVDSLSRDVKTAVFSLLFTNITPSSTLEMEWNDGVRSSNTLEPGMPRTARELWRDALELLPRAERISQAQALLALLQCEQCGGTEARADPILKFMDEVVATVRIVSNVTELFSACCDCSLSIEDLAESLDNLLCCRGGSVTATGSLAVYSGRGAGLGAPAGHAPEFSRFLVERCLPLRYTMSAADVVLARWGSGQLLASGHLSQLASGTSMLLALLMRVTAEDLAATPRFLAKQCNGGDNEDGYKGCLLRGIPLSVLFSQAVSRFLDVGDKQTRILGLKVAVEFGNILGHKMVFAELDTAPSTELGSAVGAEAETESRADHLSTSATASFRRKLGILELSDSEVSSSESESDSDSDLEPFEQQSAGDSDRDISLPPAVRPFLTTYLRVCLELLQCHESTPETHHKHHAALVSIPAIVARSPVDINDLCVPVLLELTRLGNEFNIPRFGDLRGNAVHALLFRYPRLALPAVTHQIQAGALTLGAKVEMLSSLSRASYALAGLTHMYDASYIQQSLGATGRIPTGPADRTAASANGAAAATSGVDDASSTVVKRPRKLALMSESARGCGARVVVFRNEFADLLDLFLEPVMLVLQSAEHEAGLLLDAQRDEESRQKVVDPVNVRSKVEMGMGRSLIQIVPSESERISPPAISSAAVNVSTSPIVAVMTSSVTAEPSSVAVFQANSALLTEGLGTILPAHCIIALSGFIHCCVNCPRQRALIQQTLRLCEQYKGAVALTLRRAALLGLHSALESWKYQKLYSHRYKSRGSSNSSNEFTSAALKELCDVMHMRDLYDHEFTQYRGPSNEDDIAVYAVIEWCARSLAVELDVQCMIMKNDLIQMVRDVL